MLADGVERTARQAGFRQLWQNASSIYYNNRTPPQTTPAVEGKNARPHDLLTEIVLTVTGRPLITMFACVRSAPTSKSWPALGKRPCVCFFLLQSTRSCALLSQEEAGCNRLGPRDQASQSPPFVLVARNRHRNCTTEPNSFAMA